MRTKKGLAMLISISSAMLASFLINICVPFWRALLIVVLIIISIKSFEYLKKE
jgi:uncharacterized membrane protein